jgi:branched-subunit amino acid aminotransferase/4-amino-4-deoxychorismate lyase
LPCPAASAQDGNHDIGLKRPGGPGPVGGLLATLWAFQHSVLVDPENACSWLWLEGEFVPKAAIPLSDRGFRYGMSVFETLRISDGSPGFLGPHMERLRSAALQCGFSPPQAALSALPLLLSQINGTGVARVYLTAGDGAPTAPARHCRVAVLFEARKPTAPASYALRSASSAHLPPFGGLKTANYWANAEALRQAHSQGADEALLFLPDGRLIGACMANVFVKTMDGWVTPSLECGARNGVVREWTLRHLCATEGIILRETLQSASSVFLTSSWIGAVQAHLLDDRPLRLRPEIAALRPL